MLESDSQRGVPRCPNGFHRSPDGDCERVSSENSGNSGSDSADDEDDDNNNAKTAEERNDDNDDDGNGYKTEPFNSRTPISQTTGCKGSADCFGGTVTEIVDGDGDTLDVDNIRIRLSMVNTPERGDPGYAEATYTTETECPKGSETLVDEDDGHCLLVSGAFKAYKNCERGFGPCSNTAI